MTRALCVFLLLFGVSWSLAADDAKPLTTVLLVARAELPDSNFKDAIVLVMNNVGPAPGGVIINRPTRIPVSRLFPDVEGSPASRTTRGVLPAARSRCASCRSSSRAATPPDDAIPVVDDVYISANRPLLTEAAHAHKPMEGLRIFIGYSGWAPGQLESEIARGDWTLKPADASTIFDRKSERIWPEESAPEGARRI